MIRRILLPAILLLVLLVYWPVIHGRFVNWDDDFHLTNNPLFDPPMVGGIARFWSSGFLGLYIPLTYSIWILIGYATMHNRPHGADRYLRPRAFHAANLVAHLVAVAAVFLALRRLLRRSDDDIGPGETDLVADRRTEVAAAAGTLLFALHPLQVEAIAWVSGFRDVLSGCFCAIAIWQYVAYLQTSRRGPNDPPGGDGTGAGHYVAMFLASAAAMLSKPNAAALPLVLLAVHLCWMRRSVKSAVAALLPVLALAAPCLIANRLSQALEGSPQGSPLLRPIIALDALGFYLAKLLVPIGLVPDYGRFPLRVLRGPAIWTVGLALLSGAALMWWVIRRGRASAGKSGASLASRVAAGIVVAVAALVPVLGLVPFDFQEISSVADHYMYVAMIGIAMAAAAMVDAALRRGRVMGPAAIIGAGCAVVAMALLTRDQIGFWRDSTTIWRHELDINPRSWTGQNNIGCILMDEGDYAGAEPYFRRAIALRGDDIAAQLNLGQTLSSQSRYPEALAVYRAAVRQRPDESQTHEGLANALFNFSDLRGALVEYDRAIHARYRDPYSKAQAMHDRVKEMLRAAASTGTVSSQSASSQTASSQSASSQPASGSTLAPSQAPELAQPDRP